MQQVKSSQVKSSQVKSSQVKSSQVKSSQVIVALSFFFCTLFFSHFTFAATGVGVDNNFVPPNMTISIPVDNVPYLVPIASSSPVAVDACTGSNDKLTASAVYAVTDYKTTDNNYPIFKSSINGIGWTITAKDGSALDYLAIGATPVTLFSKAGQNGALGYFYQFQWVRYPDSNEGLHTGVNTVTLGPILNTYCYTKVNDTTPHGTGQLNALATTITLNALTCDVDTASKAGLTVTIPDVDWLKLNAAPIGVYDTSVHAQASITLTCQAGIKPRYTLMRRQAPSIAGNSLVGLDPNSTASGFNFQIRRWTAGGTTLKVDGTGIYNFGQTGSSVEVVTTAGEVRVLDLFATIFKTSNTIVPGPFTALVDVNITYN